MLIAHLSDIHFGALDGRAAEAVAADLAGRAVDLLVMSGDFTQRARPGQFEDALRFLATLPGEKLYVPGNHDVPLWDFTNRLLTPTKNYRRHVSRDLRPVWDGAAGGVSARVIGLNSARAVSRSWRGFWKDGRLSREQLRHAVAAMNAAPEPGLRVVVTHHPFLPPPGARPHGIIRRAPRALAAFAGCGVDVLLAGHLHHAYADDVRTHHERTARGMLSVQAGTATSHRRRGNTPNAFNLLTASDGGARLSVEVRTLGGGGFGTRDVTEFERGDGGWAAR